MLGPRRVRTRIIAMSVSNQTLQRNNVPEHMRYIREIDSEKRYILVVDDEIHIIKSLMRELADWSESVGLSVTGAVIGVEALDVIEEHREKIKVIIADIRMPGMSGGDMALEIRRRYPDIPIIVLTGYNDRKEIKKAKRAGIEAFLTKPWDGDELIREIEKVV